MRRNSSKSASFEFRGHWLHRESESSSWYVAWLPAGSRNLKRKSLRTTDLEEAKHRLITIANRQASPSVPARPENVTIWEIARYYADNKADKIASGKEAQWNLDTALGWYGPSTKVSELTEARQERILAAQVHLSVSYVRRIQAVLDSAMKLAVRQKLIEDAPKIIYGDAELERILDKPIVDKVEFCPSRDEIVEFIEAIPRESEHVFRYVILALTTGARAKAILELESSAVSRDGYVNLLPKGRLQNKNKRRPEFRASDCLLGWLRYWESGRYVQGPNPRTGELGPLKTIDNAFDRQFIRIEAARAGISMGEWERRDRARRDQAKQRGEAVLPPRNKITARGLRHFVATELATALIEMDAVRRSGVAGVEDLTAMMLGHSRGHGSVPKGGRITWRYTHQDEIRFGFIAQGIDRLLKDLDDRLRRRAGDTARSLFAPGQEGEASVPLSRHPAIEELLV